MLVNGHFAGSTTPARAPLTLPDFRSILPFDSVCPIKSEFKLKRVSYLF
jgi:hypothetical protein